MNQPPNPGIWWLSAAAIALLLAAVSGVLLALRRPRHWPVALYLVALVLGDGVRRALAAGPLAAPGPYAGGARAAFHLEEALYLIGPFGLALVALVVLYREVDRVRLAVVPLLWACIVAALALAYPEVRGPELGAVYLALEVGALAVVAASAAAWVRRGEALEVTALAVYALAAVGLAKVIAGPFAGDLFQRWALAWPMHVVLYGALIAVQGGGLWLSRQR